MCCKSHTSLQTSGVPDGSNNNSAVIFITSLWKMFTGFLLGVFNSHQYFKEDYKKKGMKENISDGTELGFHAPIIQKIAR